MGTGRGYVVRIRFVACAGPVARARSGRWVIVRPCRVVMVERIGIVVRAVTVVLAGVWVLRVGCRWLVERASVVVAVAWFVMSATIGTVGCGIAHVDAGADGVAVADDESP